MVPNETEELQFRDKRYQHMPERFRIEWNGRKCFLGLSPSVQTFVKIVEPYEPKVLLLSPN